MKGIEQEEGPSAHFFTAALFAYGRRSGPIAREIVTAMLEWLNVLKEAAQEARKLQEVESETDPQETAYQFTAILIGAYSVYLLGERNAFAEARTAILGGFRSLATDEVPADALESVKAWRKHLGNKDRRK